ncbi:MAG: membrane integrity-associated transporter subunit PqiC [Magnetococcales bacterium]|nr:membrane integrity-associated transporter subunit PqiC [Magnetococcales bacterium]
MAGIFTRGGRFWPWMAAVWLAGCVSGGEPQRDHYYRLRVAAPAEVQKLPWLNGAVLVESFQTAGAFRGREIAYASAGEGLRLDHAIYHFWVDSPTEMMRDQWAEFLRRSGAAREVLTPGMRLEGDFVASGKIFRLEKMASDSGANRVVVEMELHLMRVKEKKLLLKRHYAVEREVSGEGVTAAVAAMNGAVGEIFQQFLAEIPPE